MDTRKWAATLPPASKPINNPINVGFRQQALQFVHQLPCLGRTQSNIGHHDQIVGLIGGSTYKSLANLLYEPRQGERAGKTLLSLLFRKLSEDGNVDGPVKDTKIGSKPLNPPITLGFVTARSCINHHLIQQILPPYLA